MLKFQLNAYLKQAWDGFSQDKVANRSYPESGFRQAEFALQLFSCRLRKSGMRLVGLDVYFISAPRNPATNQGRFCPQ